MLGRTIGNYVVKQELGHGGMGAVYLAEHPMLGRRVAIKVLLAEYSRNPQLAARFLREARAAHGIASPHVVEVFDFGQLEDGAPYLVMEWLAGQSLAALLREQPRPPLERALHIISGIGEALSAAHAQNIVHRDLKPDNVFLVERGEDRDFVKVLDFGLAKVLEGDEGSHVKTQSNVIMGTPAYMSPEQCHGDSLQIGPHTDVYALGAMAFEMLTGRRPFTAPTTTAMLLAHVSQAPPAPRSLVPELPESMERAILCALAKKPGERFRTVDDFIFALSGKALPLRRSTGSSPILKLPEAALVTTDSTLAAAPLAPTEAALAVPSQPSARLAESTLGAVATEAAGPHSSSLPTPPRSRRPLMPLLGGAALLVSLLFAGLVWRKPAPPPAAPVAAAPTAAASVAAPSAVPPAPAPAPAPVAPPARIAIRTVPATATLALDGSAIPNPFTAHVPRSNAPHRVTATADGYQTEAHELVFDHDQDLLLTLVRKPAEARAAAAPKRIAPAAKPKAKSHKLQISTELPD